MSKYNETQIRPEDLHIGSKVKIQKLTEGSHISDTYFNDDMAKSARKEEVLTIHRFLNYRTLPGFIVEENGWTYLIEWVERVVG